MSIYRDESILKRLLGEGKTIEQNAQLHLFMLVEQNLRKVIQEARKYQIHFKRKQLTVQDIEQTLVDSKKNTSSGEIMGFQYLDSINLARRQDEFVLNDQNCDLKDMITHQLRTLRIPIGYPQITWFTVLRDGQMVNSQETQSLLQLKDIVATDQKQISESKKAFSIIHDNVVSILSPHQLDLLKQFTTGFDYETNSLTLNTGSKFVELLHDLQNFTDVAAILPFIIQYLYAQQDMGQINLYKRRKLIVHCISAIVSNSRINLEFYLHQIIKILVNFLVSDMLDIQVASILNLQQSIARCLNLIIDRYAFKYLTLRANINKSFLDQLDQVVAIINQKSSMEHLLKAYSLIQYFSSQIIDHTHFRFVSAVLQIIKGFHNLNGDMEIEADQQTDQQTQIISLIELQLEQILLRIVDGLDYLLPDDQNQAQRILSDALQILRELGREQSLIISTTHSDGIIL